MCSLALVSLRAKLNHSEAPPVRSRTCLMSAQNYYSAREAAEKLHISRSTLYAYVSRGLIRSEASTGPQRERRYLAADIDKLLQRKAVRQAPENAAMGALDWGLPVLASSISRIQGGRLYYRQHELLDLGQQQPSPEALLALLWDCDTVAVAPVRAPFACPPLAGLNWLEQLQVLLPVWAAQDLNAWDLSETGALASAQRLVAWVWALAAGVDSAPDLLSAFEPLLPEARQRELLRLLILVTADHELNVSAFSARCVASARGTPHAALSAALAALTGRRHGGLTQQVEALLAGCEQADSVALGLKNWLQQQGHLPGFGHPLYPQGDPRWPLVRELLERDFAASEILALALELAERGTHYLGQPPSLDFALVLASRFLAPGRRTALDWFALGRLGGWLAHVQEQYGQPELIRPRARLH